MVGPGGSLPNSSENTHSRGVGTRGPLTAPSAKCSDLSNSVFQHFNANVAVYCILKLQYLLDSRKSRSLWPLIHFYPPNIYRPRRDLMITYMTPLAVHACIYDHQSLLETAELGWTITIY
jgi:hypothetical protein